MAVTCSGSCQRILGPGGQTTEHTVCAMQHSQSSVSLVSVLSLAAVWIPLVLAGGWLLSLGSSVFLLVRGLQSTDLEQQILVMSSWTGTEKSTGLLLPGSHNSHQMRNTAWACSATGRTGSCWYWATGTWCKAGKQVPEPSLSQHLHSCPMELPSLVYGLSPAHL